MASILPNQIPPESTDLISAQDPKKIAHNWWLWAYNISQAVLGNSGSSAAAFSAQLLTELDLDASSTDQLGLVQRVSSLEKQISSDPFPPTIDTNALLLAQDSLLQDAIPRAQPVSVISVGASPFTYTALFDGTLIVNGGTVSALAVSRDGTTFYATATGSVPMSRLDQIKMTYTGSPTMTFFPR